MPQIVDERTGRVRWMTANEYFDVCEERIRHFRDLLSKESSPNGTAGISIVIRRWEEERDRALDGMIDDEQDLREDWNSRRYRRRDDA